MWEVLPLFEYATIGLGVLLFAWLLITNERFEAMVLVCAGILGLLIEFVGVRQFHLYYYAEDFSWSFGAFPEATPLAIVFGWALVFFTTRRLANRLVTPWWLMPSVAGLLALSLDFFLDPMLASAKAVALSFAQFPDMLVNDCIVAPVSPDAFGAGLWNWCLVPEMEQYAGVPAANYLGWFITVAGFTLLLNLAAHLGLNQNMPVWRQIVILLLVTALSFGLIVGGLWLFKWLYVQGVKGWWILLVFVGLGVWGLIRSGMQRTRWGFEWPAVSLLVLDAAICWYAYFSGQISPTDTQALIFAVVTVVAFLLAIWILVGWPFPLPATQGLPFVIVPTSPITDAQIEAALEQMDAPADQVVTNLFGAGQVDEVNALLQQLLQAHNPVLFDQLPPELQAFILDVEAQAATFNAGRIANGQALFKAHVGTCVTALTVASLPEGYAMQTSGHVLGRTQRMQRPAALKRIVETAQYVLYLIERHGLSQPVAGDAEIGKGVKAVWRVRLMHGAIRWLINQHLPGTGDDDLPSYQNNDFDAKPINQIEMAYTLLCFCWVTLRAIRDAGGQYTEAQANDYVYLWRSVGLMMGVNAALLPTNVHQAAGIFEQLKQQGLGASEDGRRLTDSALWVMSEMMTRKANVGPVLNRLLPRVMMADLVDAPTRDVLGVPPLNFIEANILRPAMRFLFSIYGYLDEASNNGIGYDIKQQVGIRMLRYYVDHRDLVGTDLFEIPTDLGV